MYVEPIKVKGSMVPDFLKGEYNGRKFKVKPVTSMSVPMDAGLWSGGSREVYTAFRLSDGEAVYFPWQSASPFTGVRSERTFDITPGYVVVMHSYFCGKDSGLTIFVHPDNVAKLIGEG